MMASGVLLALLWRGLPPSLGLSGLAVLAFAAACLWAGHAFDTAESKKAMAPFAFGFLLAGLLSVPFAVIQVSSRMG